MIEKLKIYYTPQSTDATTIINRNLAIVSNTYLSNSIVMATMYQADANRNANDFLYDEDRKKTYLLR